jgi:hypothetical protein
MNSVKNSRQSSLQTFEYCNVLSHIHKNLLAHVNKNVEGHPTYQVFKQ